MRRAEKSERQNHTELQEVPAEPTEQSKENMKLTLMGGHI